MESISETLLIFENKIVFGMSSLFLLRFRDQVKY